MTPKTVVQARRELHSADPATWARMEIVVPHSVRGTPTPDQIRAQCPSFLGVPSVECTFLRETRAGYHVVLDGRTRYLRPIVDWLYGLI